MFSNLYLGNTLKKGVIMDFGSSQTRQNIARAFAGLCQDGARLQFMSKDALDDQMQYLAKLLEEMGKHKIGQAQRLYDLMLEHNLQKKDNVVIEAGYPFEKNEIKTSLNRAAVIEEFEGANLFVQFAVVAKDEGFSKISSVFELIAKVSLKHYKILKTLAQNYNNRLLYKNSTPLSWVCSNCGNFVTDKQSWKNCPLCQKAKGYVILPEDKLISS